MNKLCLKFIVHAGEFEVQEIGDRSELIGTDVITAHCLLKNTVALPEYVLLTRAYADDVTALELPAAEGSDDYDVIGPIEYDTGQGTKRISVVKVTDVREAGAYTFEDLRGQLADRLRQQKPVAGILEDLRAKTHIDIRQ